VKVFGLMLVRNEADILAVNVQHHLAAGVDRLVIVDNGSSDDTRRVLRELASDTRVRFSRDEGPYRQSEITTELAREAFLEGADWVLPIDADEFWVGADGASLRGALAGTDASALQVQLVNFAQRREQTAAEPAGLLHLTRRPPLPVGPIERIRELVEGQEIGFVESLYPPKWISRASPTLGIGMGNHELSGLDGPWQSTDRIVCFHAPLRARDVLAAKMADHGRRAAELGEDGDLWWQAHRWRRLHAAGELDREWAANSYCDDRLDVYGKPRPVVFDPRLRDLMAPWVERLDGAVRRRSVAVRSPPEPSGDRTARARLARYEAGLGLLRKQIEQRDEVIAERRKDIEFLQGEVRGRDAALAERARDIEFLRQESSRTLETLAARERDVAWLRRELDLRESALADRERGIAFLRGEVGDREGALAAAQASAARSGGELDRLRPEIEGLRAELERVRAGLARLRSERDGLRADGDRAREELERERQAHERSRGERVAREAELAGARAALGELEAAGAVAAERARAELALARAAIAGLESSAEAATRTESDLRAALDAQRGRLAELESALVERAELLAELRTRLAAAEQARAALAADAAADAERLDILERKSDHLERHAAQQEEGIAWLREEVALRDRRLAEITASPGWRLLVTGKTAATGLRRRAGAAAGLPRRAALALLRKPPRPRSEEPSVGKKCCRTGCLSL
jgi:glycosyltransferase involved in cell wall biosynthesis/uncharacterized protein (DUF3084 family)